jgi:hypothetical protein
MQTKAGSPTRVEQHSLSPIQLEATGLERGFASTKRGQGKRLGLALLGSLLAMAGLLLWMRSGDGHSAYAAAAKELDALYAQQETAFANCTLLQENASQEMLRTAIEAASQSYGKAYEKQLAPCSRALANLERQLAAVDVPLSMKHRVEGLRRASGALNRAIERYRSYLLDPERAYDFTTATPHIDNVVDAWSNYDVQRQNTFDALHTATPTADAPSMK